MNRKINTQSTGMSATSLLKLVRQDIEDFLKQPRGIISNERDIQASLAMYLCNSANHYDSVELEYLVPVEELVKFDLQTWTETLKKKQPQPDSPKLLPETLYPWKNKYSMWVDIVVCHEGHFVPIELKYATKPVETVDAVTRFGEPLLNSSIPLVRDQAASDLVMYNYWKDVRRIELLNRRYAGIDGGIAVIVTNAPIYWRGSNLKQAPAYQQFNTANGQCMQAGEKEWGKISKKISDSHPNFSIDGNYTCRWETMNITGLKPTPNGTFRYLLTEIK